MSKYLTAYPWWFAAMLVGATSTLGCAVETAPAEELASASEPIINGTVMAANEISAAVYHYSTDACNGAPGWFSRPCSGTVIRKANNHTYVLTARHCVTVDGSHDGTLLTANNLRVTTALSPGPVPSGGQPPSSAITADGLWAASVSGFYEQYDGAILSVPGNLPLAVGSSGGEARLLVTFMTTSELQTLNPPLEIYGYGRNVVGDCDGDLTSGAGTLRWAGQIVLGNVYSNAFFRTGTNPAGQAQYHGDSGGGTFYRSPRAGHFWLAGVHSRASEDLLKDSDFGGEGLAAFIQSTLGNLYLAPFDTAYQATSKNVGASGSAGSKLTWTYTGDSTKTRVSYVNNTLVINGKCVQDMKSGAAVELHTCVTTGTIGTSQKWTASGATYTTLTNGTGRCLALNGTSVISASCTGTYPTTWAFRTSP